MASVTYPRELVVINYFPIGIIIFMSTDGMEIFLAHLALVETVAPSTINIAIATTVMRRCHTSRYGEFCRLSNDILDSVIGCVVVEIALIEYDKRVLRMH
jgi:hypothetical protein